MPQTKLPARFRSGILACFVDAAKFVGVDGLALLRKVRIDSRWLQDYEGWLPAGIVASLFEQAARRSGRDDFGILLAECQSLATLGPVALVLEHEPTVRDLLNAAIEFRPTVSDAIQIGLSEDAGTAITSFDVQINPSSPQIDYFVVAVALGVFVDATEGKWRPSTVNFRHARPRHRESFARYFQCPVFFDEEFNGWTCDSSSMDIACVSGSKPLATYARHLLHLTAEMRDVETFSSRVAAAIYLLLRYGTPTLDRVAANLGTSRRTIQRRLAIERQSFEKVLNGVRRNMVRRSLAHSAQPISQIAYSVGFSSPSAFSRWFADEFKCSPSRWRSRSARRRLHRASPGEFEFA